VKLKRIVNQRFFVRGYVRCNLADFFLSGVRWIANYRIEITRVDDFALIDSERASTHFAPVFWIKSFITHAKLEEILQGARCHMCVRHCLAVFANFPGDHTFVIRQPLDWGLDGET